MTQYPDKVEVQCPVCSVLVIVEEVEKYHDKEVQCPFCKAKSHLRRFEICKDPMGFQVIDVAWGLLREDMRSPN